MLEKVVQTENYGPEHMDLLSGGVTPPKKYFLGE